MLSSRPPCDSVPSRGPENQSKQVQWASVIQRSTSVEGHSKPQLDSSKAPGPGKARRPSRLTVKYDRGQLQTWLETEEWVDAQLQELYQERAMPSVPEFDLEDFIELSSEEQKSKLQAILQECPSHTEPFITELLHRLKKLRRLSRPQK
ncbi:protein phosphatase 1 regulatory subunit 14D [Monodelphis domestica]|uniref:Protein phosphatase 1 regulatory subunit 14 n=1 Tax=Monodelphis domestica TaxID=13616 RepID=F6SZL7_MONDO|nr:protein phosphatase 1 regulatory subunit 14D [Monodelphis domestica]XP_056666259.1 protein phosphatase 1 regulatory subunit 14D [Monodelphis domestica]XP_056666260.1 protein phosphatase 1 regulatory subunit 14D [Monodelphis domestica]